MKIYEQYNINRNHSFLMRDTDKDFLYENFYYNFICVNLQSGYRSSIFDRNVKMQFLKFNWELPYRCQYCRVTRTLLPRRALDLCGIFIKYTRDMNESQTLREKQNDLFGNSYAFEIDFPTYLFISKSKRSISYDVAPQKLVCSKCEI